jgi:hypothetical protein
MATVVVVFVETAPLSSTPRPVVVMASSVRKGAISEIAPTKVVLPPAKPPAITILTGRRPELPPGDQPADRY